jgi:hypothetical protein
MPNIELYGLGLVSEAEAQGWRTTVFRLFEDAPYVDEVMVSVTSGFVLDRHGNSHPFIRLWSTPEKYLDDVKRRLEILPLDLEEPSRLIAFREAKL